MNIEKKESYVQPELVKHELLRDITAGGSGHRQYGNGVGRLFFHVFGKGHD
jgi:hypothetical protein